MNINAAKKMGYTKVYFTFDCVGDTILLISALRYLYDSTKEKILVATYYKELVENCEYVDVLDDFCEDMLSNSSYQMLLSKGLSPIFISATNFAYDGRHYRPIWGDHHILANICSKLGVLGMIDIAPNLFLSTAERERGRFFTDSQIAIVSSGNQPYKAIPFDVAQSIVYALKDHYNFVQIGSLSDPPLEGALDKRAFGGLRGTASILYNSDLFVGGIGGLMHMARAVNCRAVITFSAAEPVHLENYNCNINVFAPDPKCNLCGINESFPYLINCQQDYSCIKGIVISEVESAIHAQMNKLDTTLEIETASIEPNPVQGVEDYIKRFGKIKEV